MYNSTASMEDTMSSMAQSTETMPAHLLTQAQQMTLSIIPHITGPLSCLGSAIIMRDVILHGEARGVYQRLLFGMSLCDFVSSLWYSLSTIPVPEGTPQVWAATGTTASCSAQGFFIQISLATALYNSSLSIYYMLLGYFKWNEQRILGKEAFMHLVPLAVGFSTAFAGLGLKLFNNSNLWCWIAPLPFDCRQSYHGMGETNCIRGDNASVYRMYFFYVPLWTSIIVATIAMALVYFSVLRREKEVDSFQTGGVALRKQSKRVAWQAFWYILAFYISWIPASLHCIIELFPQVPKAGFIYSIAMVTFSPFQGFLNFMVYFRSKLVKYRRNHPEDSVFASVGKVVLHANPNSVSVNATPKVTRLDSNIAPISASKMSLSYVVDGGNNLVDDNDAYHNRDHDNYAYDKDADDNDADDDVTNDNVDHEISDDKCLQ